VTKSDRLRRSLSPKNEVVNTFSEKTCDKVVTSFPEKYLPKKSRFIESRVKRCSSVPARI
jgi:hypothetical protein